MVLSNRASKLLDEVYKRNNEQYDYVSLIPSGELPPRKLVYQNSMLEVSKPINLKDKKRSIKSVNVIKDDISDMPELEDIDSDDDEDEEDDSKKDMVVIEDKEESTFFDDDEEDVDDDKDVNDDDNKEKVDEVIDKIEENEEKVNEDKVDKEKVDEGKVEKKKVNKDSVEEINNKILFGLLENIKKEEKDKKDESKPKEFKPGESEQNNNDSIEGGGVKRIKLAQHYDFF